MKLKGLTSGATVGLGLNAILTAVDAGERISEGEGVVPSIAKATVSGLAWDTINGLIGGPGSMALMAAPIAPMVIDGMTEAGRYNTKKAGKVLNNHIGGEYANSDNTQRMRQTAYERMNAMSQNTQQIIGSEARMYYNRNVY